MKFTKLLIVLESCFKGALLGELFKLTFTDCGQEFLGRNKEEYVFSAF